jgi:hypothetical protein
MPFHDIEVQSEDNMFVPIVKHTFIALSKPFVCATRRLKSVPASLRLCTDCDCSSSYDNCSEKGHAVSDVSTDAWTDASCDEDDGVKTPSASDSEDSFSVASLPVSPASQSRPTKQLAANAFSSMSMLSTHPTSVREDAVPPPPTPLPRPARLNAGAALFKPMSQAPKEDPVHPHYKHHIAKVIKAAMKILQESELAADVQISENLQDCTITVKTNGEGEVIREAMLAVAKQALLGAAGQSKCIFLMGFAAPDPFTMIPLGFEATFGAMENAKTACWHVFKKGFCRHESGCRMQHAVAKVPIRVIVESAQNNAPPAIANGMADSVADLVSTVMSALKKSPYVASVEACKDASAQTWSIEVSPLQQTPAQEEYLLSLAKHALLDTGSSSDVVGLMGRTAKPFLPKPNGFVAVLGEMKAENKVCWDYYSSGFCRKGCACRWEHPDCLMPLSVHIKSCRRMM